MHFMKHLLTGTMTLVLATAAMAATIDLAGVKVEDTNTVAGTKLQLNGAGIRVKFVKVYVAELYATTKVHTLEELIAAPGPKRLRMTFLREVDGVPLGKLMTRGVEDNVPKAQLSKMVPGLIRMGDIFTTNKSYAPGETITFDWIPGTGLIITGKGKQQGDAFKEPEFFNGMMAIWMGHSPGDWKLKDALLDVK